MTQFIRLTRADGPILVNVAQIDDLAPHDAGGTAITSAGNSFRVNEPFDVIEANLRLMAYITDMEATA